MLDKITEPRQLRGLEILSKGDTVRKVKRATWAVQSQSGKREYEITSSNFRRIWTCTCADYRKRKMDCKHIFAVKFSLIFKNEEEIEKEEKEEELFEDTHIEQNIQTHSLENICPQCGSIELIKNGKRKTKFGEVQRYQCKTCNFRFTIDNGFSRMKHDPMIITLTLDLYFKGLSYRKIADHILQFHKLKVNQTTLMRWVKKYLASAMIGLPSVFF